MKDNFSKQSAGYARYRPVYPQELYDFILNNVKSKQVAWDCGTGNGQAAKELAKVFDRVYATDISQNKLIMPPARKIFFTPFRLLSIPIFLLTFSTW